MLAESALQPLTFPQFCEVVVKFTRFVTASAQVCLDDARTHHDDQQIAEHIQSIFEPTNEFLQTIRSNFPEIKDNSVPDDLPAPQRLMINNARNLVKAILFFLQILRKPDWQLEELESSFDNIKLNSKTTIESLRATLSGGLASNNSPNSERRTSNSSPTPETRKASGNSTHYPRLVDPGSLYQRVVSPDRSPSPFNEDSPRALPREISALERENMGRAPSPAPASAPAHTSSPLKLTRSSINEFTAMQEARDGMRKKSALALNRTTSQTSKSSKKSVSFRDTPPHILGAGAEADSDEDDDTYSSEDEDVSEFLEARAKMSPPPAGDGNSPGLSRKTSSPVIAAFDGAAHTGTVVGPPPKSQPRKEGSGSRLPARKSSSSNIEAAPLPVAPPPPKKKSGFFSCFCSTGTTAE